MNGARTFQRQHLSCAHDTRKTWICESAHRLLHVGCSMENLPRFPLVQAIWLTRCKNTDEVIDLTSSDGGNPCDNVQPVEVQEQPMQQQHNNHHKKRNIPALTPHGVSDIHSWFMGTHYHNGLFRTDTCSTRESICCGQDAQNQQPVTLNGAVMPCICIVVGLSV